jgi:hypothetical protein
MGWTTEEIEEHHEGYVAALAPHPQGGWRELSYGTVKAETFTPATGPARITRFRVACDCGWRSRVYVAGDKAVWWPFILELNDACKEENARMVWLEHIRFERKAARNFSVLIPGPIEGEIL